MTKRSKDVSYQNFRSHLPKAGIFSNVHVMQVPNCMSSLAKYSSSGVILEENSSQNSSGLWYMYCFVTAASKREADGVRKLIADGLLIDKSTCSPHSEFPNPHILDLVTFLVVKVEGQYYASHLLYSGLHELTRLFFRTPATRAVVSLWSQ